MPRPHSPRPITAAAPVLAVPLPQKKVGDRWQTEGGNIHTIISIRPLVTTVEGVRQPILWDDDGTNPSGHESASARLVLKLPALANVTIIVCKQANSMPYMMMAREVAARDAQFSGSGISGVNRAPNIDNWVATYNRNPWSLLHRVDLTRLPIE